MVNKKKWSQLKIIIGRLSQQELDYPSKSQNWGKKEKNVFRLASQIEMKTLRVCID